MPPLVHSSKHTITTYNGCKTLYVWDFNQQWVANLVWGFKPRMDVKRDIWCNNLQWVANLVWGLNQYNGCKT
jgi:hypothetical protein